jgi:DNA-cytosine methyltransferase
MRVLDLFSGIGGFPLGIVCAELDYILEPVQFVETDQFCQRVLTERFPGIPIHSDIKTFYAEPYSFDVICASPPCPPFSNAGKQKASADERNLFPEVTRLIKEVQPLGVLIENVPGILSAEKGQFFKNILSQFTEMGYDCEWGCVSVEALGGVHKRERLFLAAYPSSKYQYGDRMGKTQAWATAALDPTTRYPAWTEGIRGICGEHAWVPPRMDEYLMREISANQTTKDWNYKEYKPRLKALGNSICPQQAAIAWRKLYKNLYKWQTSRLVPIPSPYIQQQLFIGAKF